MPGTGHDALPAERLPASRTPPGVAQPETKILPRSLPHLPWTLRALAAAGAVLLSAAAMADTRIFIIDSSDGYGVDGCLASGAPCGEQVATAWCRSHDYAHALDFGRVENEPLVPASSGPPRASCAGPLCDGAVAITCSR